MANRDRQIEEFIGKHEGITQARAKEELAAATGMSERTIWNHVKHLEGRTIVRVRSGREVHLYSKRAWSAMEAATVQQRAAHSRNLREVLVRFRDQIPVVDEFGAFLPLGYQPAFVPSSQLRYDPDQPLEVEGHALLEDLLLHLGLLDLTPDPVDAWRALRDGVRSLAAAYEGLWKLCESEVTRTFRLAAGSTRRADWVSEQCVAYMYRLAIAAAEGGRERVSALQSRSVRVDHTGGRLEYWKGGELFVRVQARKAGNQARFRRWVNYRLRKLGQRVNGEDALELASRVVGRLNPALVLRDRLCRALDEAFYFEVFPGACRFVRSPA